MRLAPLLLPHFLASCIALATLPACAQDSGRYNHFIDFRARPGALWGHTFILYGRVDERGQPVELYRLGLYPDDGRPGLILGTFVPVRAAVRGVPDDFSETPSAIYRRTLSPAQYARLKATVNHIRANDHAWHILAHNCNHFANTVARSIGLYTPPNILVPNAWVRALKAMNQR